MRYKIEKLNKSTREFTDFTQLNSYRKKKICNCFPTKCWKDINKKIILMKRVKFTVTLSCMKTHAFTRRLFYEHYYRPYNFK